MEPKYAVLFVNSVRWDVIERKVDVFGSVFHQSIASTSSSTEAHRVVRLMNAAEASR